VTFTFGDAMLAIIAAAAVLIFLFGTNVAG
jgi:hypothetical protein